MRNVGLFMSADRWGFTIAIYSAAGIEPFDGVRIIPRRCALGATRGLAATRRILASGSLIFLVRGFLNILREKRDSRVKVSKLEEKEIAKHYKREHEKLMARRTDGEAGILDFESYQ